MVERRRLLPDLTEDREAKPRSRSRSRNPAGRPKGIKSQMQQAIEKMMAYKDSGELPHEFLLRVSRGDPIAHGKDKDGKAILYQPTFSERILCAKDAAPYFAPKLTAVEVIKSVSDEELDQIIAGAAHSAGLTVDTIKKVGEDGVDTYTPTSEDDAVYEHVDRKQ